MRLASAPSLYKLPTAALYQRQLLAAPPPYSLQQIAPASFFRAKKTEMAPSKQYNRVEAFHKKLASSRRILALCGAGLSSSSGLPTFRGAGGLWRNHDATILATPGAFNDDPGLVWLFYAYRRHMALQAKPNPGHYALAELASKHPDFLCLTQNVDNLSPRANHPPEKLRLLHGSLFDLRCSLNCGYVDRGNMDDPLCPALAAASQDVEPGKVLPLLDPKKPLAHIPASELPKCPQCRDGLLRPGVVWFGEQLDDAMLAGIDAWIDAPDASMPDIVLVIGTSAAVYPAAGYVHAARGANTSVVTINPEAELPKNLAAMKEEDFAFAGDAAEFLPKLLEPIIGKMKPDGTFEK
ncbi:DHS-like NAD/FAD-binding domain-containing protein [Thozetella sp. PMI_491]|nr:DHS-like NAD/FAD-binding domain-containing protein [Thozetella sp. PMI_491]